MKNDTEIDINLIYGLSSRIGQFGIYCFADYLFRYQCDIWVRGVLGQTDLKCTGRGNGSFSAFLAGSAYVLSCVKLRVTFGMEGKGEGKARINIGNIIFDSVYF